MDLGAVAVGVGPEQVGDLAAVGRRVGTPAVALAGRHRHRPRVVGVDLHEGRRPVALDAGQQEAVGGPHRIAALQDLLGRAPVDGHHPDPVLLGIGDPGAVGRHHRLRVVPVGDQRPTRGETTEVAGRGVDRPDVGGVAVPDERRGAAVGPDIGVARPLGGGDRLEPPVRGRADVGPGRDRLTPGLHRAPPHRLLSHHYPPRSRRARRSRGRRACPGRSRPPGRTPSGGQGRRGYDLPGRSRTG